MDTRGIEREKTLNISDYYTDNYFNLRQLSSFSHQISDIYHLKPKNILEVGIGNGITSTILKRSGLDITTVDINESLSPDICSPILELNTIFNKCTFDLIVCCEVLEHIPFENFDECIEIFSNIGQRLYLTLPDNHNVFGFGGFFSLPKLPNIFIKALIKTPFKKQIAEEHFWEVNSSKMTSKKAIHDKMRKFYTLVNCSRYGLNPYHISFTASKFS